MKKITYDLDRGSHDKKQVTGYGRDGLACHKFDRWWAVDHLVSGMSIGRYDYSVSTRKEAYAQMERLYELDIDWHLTKDELTPILRERMGDIRLAMCA